MPKHEEELLEQLLDVGKVKAAAKGEYGGKGEFHLPTDHHPAVQVPRGGSCCQNCKFVDAAKHECKNPNYIEWKGSPKLPPLPLNEICSDWWEGR